MKGFFEINFLSVIQFAILIQIYDLKKKRTPFLNSIWPMPSRNLIRRVDIVVGAAMAIVVVKRKKKQFKAVAT